jgi:hypothetical protein
MIIQTPQSWYDVVLVPPTDPRELIAQVSLNGLVASFVRSTSFTGAASWTASPFTLTGSLVCTSLHGDDLLEVANAAQWTLSHQGINTAASTPIPVRRVIFMRGGS